VAILGLHHHVGLLAGPIDSRERAHDPSSSPVRSSPTAGREVPLRVLIGRRSRAPRPVGAFGASHRREALVSCGPSTGQARLALSRRWSATLLAAQSEPSPGLRPGSHTHNLPTSENNLTTTAEVVQ
jgi:hypothetical protein